MPITRTIKFEGDRDQEFGRLVLGALGGVRLEGRPCGGTPGRAWWASARVRGGTVTLV
jgi:hypothetical protein